MQAEEFQALKDSIEAIGVQNPITLLDGMVIDGWHRYSAAAELGMDCPNQPLASWVDPVDFVRAQNKNRRHLGLGAWALIEVSLRNWKPSHRPDKGELNSPLSQSSNQEMADAVGVTKRTIQHAKSVQSHAAPEVIEAVKRGEVGLSKAAAIAKLPMAEQAAALHKPAPKPATKPAPVVEPIAEEPEDYTELDAAQDLASERQHVIESLRAQIAIKNMDGTEEEKQQAAAIIAEQAAYIKTLEATLRAVTLARDSLMEEAVQMKRQMAMQRKEIDKLKNNK